jgi:hypothetical protein
MDPVCPNYFLSRKARDSPLFADCRDLMDLATAVLHFCARRIKSRAPSIENYDKIMTTHDITGPITEGRVLINAQIGGLLSGADRKTFAQFETYRF